MPSGGVALSYAQVNRLTSIMAFNLYSGGGDFTERIVALWQSRGVALLLSQLAVAKSGAAWLPFDLDTPVSLRVHSARTAGSATDFGS